MLSSASTVAAAKEPVKEPLKCTHGVIIQFDGEILPGLQHYLYRKIEAAKSEGADLIILEIDSPGGELYTSLEIAEYMQKIDWAHTVAYVPRQAISGAAIASLGCDEILMAPKSRIGDAGAIVFGSDSLFRLAPEKIVSYLTGTLRGLAEAKGRPTALAEAFADKDLKIHHVRNLKTEKETYISERDLKADPGEWKDLGMVAASGEGRFLTLTGQEAVKLDLANALIDNREDLAARFGLHDLPVVKPTGVDVALEILNSWLVTGLLLLIGLVGLYVELMAPGHGVGGLIAAACFLLLFWSHFLGGTAGWLEVVLFLLGVVFVLVEILLLPGTILPGLIGGALIVTSLVMLSQGFLVPATMRQVHTLAGTMGMIVVSFGLFVVVAVVISRQFESLPLFSHLTLKPPEADDASGEHGFQIGDVGTAHTPLRPGGKGRFSERTVDVLADGDFVDRGTDIRIVRVTGNQVIVERVEETGGTP